MAHAVSFPSGAPSEHRNLAFWMQRTLKELANVRSEPTNDAIHDLRVALRRCRSIAAAMEEVDPHPDWKEMRSCARKLFRALGELRDVHVTAEWLDRLHPEEDALKRQMLLALKDGEHLARAKAQRRVAGFDQSRWKKLTRSLRSRVRRVPADGEAACCLALERFEEARELHRRALRTENAKPWHALRIGAKHFRYTVESLLPAAHEQWRDSLKRLQEILGNIHDLDVLAGRLKRMRGQQLEENLQDWQARIENARQENLRTYRQITLGTTSVWNTWLSGFPRD